MPSTRINGQTIDFTIAKDSDGRTSYTISGDGAFNLHKTLSERGVTTTGLTNGEFTVTAADLACLTVDSTLGKLVLCALQSAAELQPQI